MKNIQFYLLISISLIIFSCSEKKTSDEIKTEKVEPDIKILSEVIIDKELGISYQVPLEWELMSSELSERYVARLDAEKYDGNFVVYQPKAFYFNASVAGLLRVGSVTKSEDSKENELTIEHYIALYKKFNSEKNIRRKIIKTNNLTITQLIIEKSNLVSFKNILMNKNNKIVQFDFSIQRKDYENSKNSIETSLASIKNL